MEATKQQQQQHTGRLDVEHRAGLGKSDVRKLRQQGLIPGICYGLGQEPVPIALDPKELLRALDPDKRSNTVIKMRVTGSGNAHEVTVMLRDWQIDALRGNVTHADFVRVDLTKEVKATVPVVLLGKAEGVKLGGTLHQVYRSIEVGATPDKIPTKIEINVDALGMGDALHVSDLKLTEGVRALLDSGATICVVTAPKAEKTAEQLAAEAAEAGAAGTAAAAPAAAPEKKEGGEKKAGGEKKDEKKK